LKINDINERITLVFVYGTLKKNEPNHRVLGNSEYVDKFVTDPKYTMYDIEGAYPAVVLRGRTRIHGELYNVNNRTLMNLDHLEGYPQLYLKTELDTPYGTAIMYVLNKKYSDVRDYYQITDGIW